MKEIITSANEICWATGKYSSNCDCNTCDHSFECSGSNVDDDDDEE